MNNYIFAQIGQLHKQLGEAYLSLAAGAKLSSEPRLVQIGHLPIEDLELSVRAVNVLRNLEIYRISQLAALTIADLKKRKNCGPRTIREIQEVMNNVGIPLKRKEEGPVSNPLGV